MNHANVDVLLQEVRSEAVPQRMGRHPLRDLRHLRSRMNGAMELARPEMVGLVLPREQPKRGACNAIPVAQEIEQLR